MTYRLAVPPTRGDLHKMLRQLHAWWGALSPEQKKLERYRADRGLIAAEISIDENGDIYFQVFDR